MIRRRWKAISFGALFVVAAAAGWSWRTTRSHAGETIRLPISTREGASVHAPSAPSSEDATPRARWIESNPRAAGYDAVRVGQVMDLSVADVYEREPREANWASRMEAEQRETLGQAFSELFTNAQVDEVDCRTATCRTVVSVAPGDLEPMLEFVQVFAPIGQVMSFEVLDRGPVVAHVAWFVAFGPEFSTLRSLQTRILETEPKFEERRAAWIERHRAKE